MNSVCLASYNGEKFIKEQIYSILEQLSDNDELIISDDGSTDSTIPVIQQFHDNRIRLFRNPEKKGVKGNFEYALSQAKGEFIFLADQDDVWEDKKIKTINTYLADYDLVVSDCSIIDSNGNIIFDSFYELKKSGRGILKNILGNTYIGCCMAFKKKILNKAIPIPSDVPMHDWWIGLTGELFGSTYFCPEKLVRYRRHEQNKSFLPGKSRFCLTNKIQFRKAMVFALIRAWAGQY